LPSGASSKWCVIRPSGLNIENEDQFYYPSYDGTDFTEAFKEGFRVAHAYVRQFVPPGTQK
jgi:hypothetical protein